MPRHPGRVERVDGVSWRGLPALAGSLPCPHHLKEGKRTRREGWQTVEALPCCCLLVDRWRGGGEVVAMCGDGIAQKRTRWPPFLSSWLLVRRGEGERRAMVRTVAAADRTGREARNGRRGRRHSSPWFSPFLFCLLLCSSLPHHLKERTGTRREGWQTVEALPWFSLSSRSVHSPSPFLLAFVLSLYIIRYIKQRQGNKLNNILSKY